ncbi:MAG: PBECR4 domain-containing protein [Peptostreptococcaceae bacterium]|nr:PBECR4 domain-containing protein [Peptostreptococcaceae bacterium]MDY5739252.1 PBECR4 domain-containing protein [Anaerovoracaceae bacterium]
MDKVQQIISWFNNYNGKSVRIISESKDFYINIDNSMLPHLLGLHYIRRDTKILKGNQLLKYIVDNKLSDADIITKGVLRNHGTNVANKVQQRIDTFRDFMENIERARIVENTNPNTRIRSSYLAIDNPRSQYIRHLAILDTGDIDIILDYDVNTLETYIVQGNDNYYSNTTIDEPIKELLFYNEEKDGWYKGSFNLQRNRELEEEQGINVALGIDKVVYNREKDEIDNFRTIEEILSTDFDIEHSSSEYEVNQNASSEVELNEEDFLER